MTTARPNPGPRATLARRLRPDGTVVAAGGPICEVETPDASAELQAWAAGVLRHLARPGDAVAADVEFARIDARP